MSQPPNHPLAADLDHIMAHTPGVWPEFDRARVFVTGGTGFIGTWLLESLFWARRRLDLDLSVTVLTRDPSAFARKAPHLAGEKGLDFVVGDVRSFAFPEQRFTHVVHAATAASAKLNLEEPLEMFDTIVGGARRVFEFAGRCGARSVLHTSSGGVYGQQPADLPQVPEDYPGAPDPLDRHAAYSEGKRMAEMIGSIESERLGYAHKVARITALVGPHLPLDIHYALGNFIRDALAGGPIRILGDGTPCRSYLYIADLAAWLWVIMVRGASNRPYNAGSDRGISLLEAARAVNRACGGNLEITVAKRPMNDGRPVRYVPSTQRARTELGLEQWIDLDTALRRTFDWCRSGNV